MRMMNEGAASNDQQYMNFLRMKREAVQVSAWCQVELAFERWMASLPVAEQVRLQTTAVA